MRHLLFFAAIITLILSVSAFSDSSCPDRIDYSNGSPLKRSDSFYYSNGFYVLRSGSIYYPNGGYLKRGENIYYPNGTYLQANSNLYYPNGGYLKHNENYYYANGGYLKRGENFYHPNGYYARRNGRLFRPDGTETAFPQTLFERIEHFGWIRADVEPKSEKLEIEFRDLFVQQDGVQLRTFWTDGQFTEFEIWLNTGIPGENVFVSINKNQTTCQLSVSE